MLLGAIVALIVNHSDNFFTGEKRNSEITRRNSGASDSNCGQDSYDSLTPMMRSQSNTSNTALPS